MKQPEWVLRAVVLTLQDLLIAEFGALQASGTTPRCILRSPAQSISSRSAFLRFQNPLQLMLLC